MKGRRAGVLLWLHLLLMVYSLSSVLSKLSGRYAWPEPGLFLCARGVLGLLGVYALGWQQIIKRMPLTAAYANKAVTVVWGLVWGVLLFDEAVTPGKLAGCALVMAGVALFAAEEGRS